MVGIGSEFNKDFPVCAPYLNSQTAPGSRAVTDVFVWAFWLGPMFGTSLLGLGFMSHAVYSILAKPSSTSSPKRASNRFGAFSAAPGLARKLEFAATPLVFIVLHCANMMLMITAFAIAKDHLDRGEGEAAWHEWIECLLAESYFDGTAGACRGTPGGYPYPRIVLYFVFFGVGSAQGTCCFFTFGVQRKSRDAWAAYVRDARRAHPCLDAVLAAPSRALARGVELPVFGASRDRARVNKAATADSYDADAPGRDRRFSSNPMHADLAAEAPPTKDDADDVLVDVPLSDDDDDAPTEGGAAPPRAPDDSPGPEEDAAPDEATPPPEAEEAPAPAHPEAEEAAAPEAEEPEAPPAPAAHFAAPPDAEGAPAPDEQGAFDAAAEDDEVEDHPARLARPSQEAFDDMPPGG